ncbi:hypothetical protein [uncultured Roseibium sp.]|uniref:hypothetical protein n=1 Tax=uncultured Roseibium sp. TaxID=1936171 RepID=UPI003216EB1F
MPAKPKNPPPHWGADPLTEYFDKYRDNQYATFHNKKLAVGDLIAIDKLFLKFLKEIKKPEPIFPIGFIFRAHGAYRAAVGAIMAGQLYESQALMRLCIEHGAYALYIGDDMERWGLWMSRNDSESSKDKVKREFTQRKVIKCIKSKSRRIAEIYVQLYDQLIDFGAHPNEMGYSMSTEICEEVGETHIDSIYLHENGFQLDFALKTVAQIGIWVLLAAQLIYSARFDLLGIKHSLNQIGQRY